MKESRTNRTETWNGFSTAEKLIREHPGESAITAIGVGFLIAQLPGRYIAAVLFKLALVVLKPAAVVFAVANLLGGTRSRSGQTQGAGLKRTSPITEPGGGQGKMEQMPPPPQPQNPTDTIPNIQLQSERV